MWPQCAAIAIDQSGTVSAACGLLQITPHLLSKEKPENLRQRNYLIFRPKLTTLQHGFSTTAELLVQFSPLKCLGFMH